MNIDANVIIRLDDLKHAVTALRDMQENVMLRVSGEPLKAQEIVKWGFDQRIRQINMEISAIRKKHNLPSQKELYEIKKEKQNAKEK